MQAAKRNKTIILWGRGTEAPYAFAGGADPCPPIF